MTAQTLSRPNAYPAKCIRCDGRIAAGDGLLARTDAGKWAADHPAACPPKPMVIAIPRAVQHVSSAGVFQITNGLIYRVQTARSSDRLYAKLWTGSTWEYAAGAVHALTEDDRMTAEQAAAFGHQHAACVYCSRSLSDPRSEQVGYGATCAANNGLPWG